MEAKELRIGNLILVDGEPTEIGLAGIESILMQEKGASKHFGYNIKFEPMPLTEDVIHKYGYRFKDGQGNYGLYTQAFYPTITVDGSGYWIFFNGNGFKIDYVHQLQNKIFAMVETEIKSEILLSD